MVSVTLSQAYSVQQKRQLIVFGLLFLLLSPLARAVEIHEAIIRIPWVKATPNGVASLLVYPELPGKHPLVIITHGTAREVELRNDVTPWQLLPQALWFARRGFVVIVVVRRGYGESSGKADYLGNGHCPQTDYEGASRKAAEDLRVAINYGIRLPQVDPTRVVAVGISTGGMATVALTADAPSNLVAAINFAGGRGSLADHDVCNPPSLVSAYRDFGKHSRTPMLWIYADNDKYFWPELAQQFDAAFRSTGGQDEFIHAPAFGNDGHLLFNHGIPVWTPLVDAFLKTHDLLLLPEPLPDVLPPNIPAPSGLSERGQQAFRSYLTLGPHKAFAMSAHHFGYSTAQISLEAARKHSLESCNRLAEASKEKCDIVFEENALLH